MTVFQDIAAAAGRVVEIEKAIAELKQDREWLTERINYLAGDREEAREHFDAEIAALSERE